MPDCEYEILCYIRKSHAPLWSDVLDAHDPQNRANEVHALLRSLLAVGLVEKTCPTDRPPRCRVRLTGRGVVALLEETSVRAENIRDEQAEQQELEKIAHAEAEMAAQQASAAEEARFARKQSLRSNRLAACSVVLGLFSWLFTRDDVLRFLSWLLQLLQHSP